MQFLDGHHWEIPVEQFDGYVADVPSKLRPIMKFWMLIYITCLFRWVVIAKYGDLFATEMMTSVHQSIAKHPWGNFNLANVIGFWIARIDDMIEFEVQQSPIIGEKIHGQAYCAATSFLIFDPASPYYLRSDVDPHDFDEVIFALARLEDDMQPIIQYFAKSFAGTC